MSLNHFSGKYEDSLNPYYDKVDAKILDENNLECFVGIQANIPATNALAITFNGIPNGLTPDTYYATYDGKYIEMYISQPFIKAFTSSQSIVQVFLSGMNPDIIPTGIDGVQLYSVYGGLGADYGYSAYSFEFNDSILGIDFHQNNEVNPIDLNVNKDLSVNLKLVYKLNN